ncbi:MAG TPA: 2-phosphosulfolactate phosphatase [candidate division Zixibacteria bacterium]|nr:2-phosphosulfolactate phosphatase [candidate division Zixibacteria bacterium]
MKSISVDVILIQGSLAGRNLSARQVVLIDVLRATSVMVTALANGARAIVPVKEPSQAVEVRAKLGVDTALLGGERNALPIENFDLGNSPLEYTPEVVAGKTIIMCSTNGTKLLTDYRYPGPVWLCSFLNLRAVCDALVAEDLSVTIVCAGNQGDFSLEDTLCAGALVDYLADAYSGHLELNDSARVALLHYNANRTRLLEALREGQHGLRLIELGYERDIAAAAEIDQCAVAPRFTEGRVALSGAGATGARPRGAAKPR